MGGRIAVPELCSSRELLDDLDTQFVRHLGSILKLARLAHYRIFERDRIIFCGLDHAVAFNASFDEGYELFLGKGFCQETEGAFVDRFNRHLKVPIPGHQDNRNS